VIVQVNILQQLDLAQMKQDHFHEMTLFAKCSTNFLPLLSYVSNEPIQTSRKR